MLVLTRKIQEQIRISDDITVTILRIKGGSVRLGIEAPRQVRVVRAELPPKNTPVEQTTIEQTAGATNAAATTAAEKRPAAGVDSATAERDNLEQLSDPERSRRAARRALRMLEAVSCPV